MPARTLPGIGLKGFWALGENGWKDENDRNLLVLSVLAGSRVLSLLSSLPATPAAGDVHLLDDTAGADANKLCVYDDGAWVKISPLEGAILYDEAAGFHRWFTGTAWVELVTGGDLLAANNLSDLANPATARTNIGADVYVVAAFATTAPVSGEVLALHVVTDAFTFPANFASPNSRGAVGTNPAASFAIDVQRQVNATGAFASIGTITISTGGVVTFATAGGTAKPVAVNDVIKLVAPITTDASIANIAVTLRGSRT